MAAGEKTEKPTPKKLKDARKKGQIARSRDLAMAAASIASTMALAAMGPHLIGGLLDDVKRSLATLGDAPLHTITAGEISALIAHNALQLALLVGPLALVTGIAAVGMHGFQGGWSFSPETLNFNWSRLNPATGLKRFGLSQSGVETLKTAIVFVTISYFTWGSIQAFIFESGSLASMAPAQAGVKTWEHAEALLWRTAWTLAALALADYGWQRYKLMSQLKMSRQEINDEHRQAEGSGQVKGRMRKLQREMAKRRMLRDVQRATVVITNPTHIAVALEYRRESMTAPKVLAMGADHMARRIRETALAHGVPMVENKPLARTLFATAEIGQVIPAPLFAAVAEVLAYLIRVKRLML